MISINSLLYGEYFDILRIMVYNIKDMLSREVKTVKECYQKYIDNLQEGHSLVKKNLTLPHTDRRLLLEQIRENSKRTYELRCENDELLQRIVFSRNAEELTEEDVEDLKEFADELFVFARQNDIGTAYRVHQLLYRYACHVGDYDLRVRQLYHMGAALFYMNPIMVELGVNLFGRKITEYFREGAEAFSQCEEIENQETVSYSLRCLSNLCITDERFTCPHQPCVPYNNIATFGEYRKYFDLMMEIFHSQEYREKFPGFNWDQAIYNLHFDRGLYYQFVQPYHPVDVLQDIYESAQYVFRHQEQIPTFRYSTKEMRVAQIYHTVRWRLGLIGTTELADHLYDMIQRADTNDFSPNGIILNLQMPLQFEYAYRAMSHAERKVYEAKMNEIEKKTRNYLLRAPHNEFNNLVTKSVGESIRYRAQHNLPLQKKFFDSLLFCHPPTYVHVRVAASLSRSIFKRMVEVNPEALVGIYDIYDVDEIKARCDELSIRIYSCALYHDVGKIMLLDYVGMYDRKILDEEFEAVKLHTSLGAALLEKTEPMELAVIARHHHRYYNEMGGYPENCRPCLPQYKPIVDIVTVCDAIEAATDNIGRCYASVKTFSELVDELRLGSGTMYSPYVVSLFDDEAFFKTIEQEMHAEREEIYFETYDARQYRSDAEE